LVQPQRYRERHLVGAEIDVPTRERLTFAMLVSRGGSRTAAVLVALAPCST
jgi:hypothetical protein